MDLLCHGQRCLCCLQWRLCEAVSLLQMESSLTECESMLYEGKLSLSRHADGSYRTTTDLTTNLSNAIASLLGLESMKGYVEIVVRAVSSYIYIALEIKIS